MTTEEHTGWLIEVEGAAPMYYKGHEHGNWRIYTVLTEDRAKAVRFARKEDAQQVAGGLPIGDFTITAI